MNQAWEEFRTTNNFLFTSKATFLYRNQLSISKVTPIMDVK